MTKHLSRPIPSEPIVSPLAREISMLRDDFNDRIVPYRQNRRAYNISVTGKRPDQVNRSLALNRHNSGIENFIRTITSTLLLHQDVWIEIVPNSNRESDILFSLFIVAGINRDSSGTLIQELPPHSTLPEGYPEDESWGQSVILDETRMVHISLPISYPGQVLKQVLIDLTEVNSALEPEWAFQQMIGQLSNAPRYDISEADRIKRLRILQVSSPIGWNAREDYRYQPWQINYYYYLLRELRFLHFVSSMRERAEIGLRDILEIAGQLCGFTASFISHGIYTPQEISNFIEEFKSGDLSFKDVRRIRSQEVDS